MKWKLAIWLVVLGGVVIGLLPLFRGDVFQEPPPNGTKERPYRPEMDKRMSTIVEPNGYTYVVPPDNYEYGVDRPCLSPAYTGNYEDVPGTNMWRVKNAYSKGGGAWLEFKSAENGEC